MQRLLLPQLLLTRFHIGNMAGQPIVEFHPQLCLERLGVHSRTHSSEQVQEIALWPLQSRLRSPNQQFGRHWQPEVRHAPPSQLRSEKFWRSHANYGERMPIDLVAGANHGRIRSVLVAPYAI